MTHDLRFALRTLRRDLGFTLFTILIVGLGTAASATVFSVVNALLLRPLPFSDPSRLVWIANRAKTEDNMSARTLQVIPAIELRDRNTSFSGIAGFFAFYNPGDTLLAGSGDPERLTGIPVTQAFFPLLGIQPLIGRNFTAAECAWRGPKVTLLSYSLWERRFASDRRIVGRTLRLDDQDVTVVGVMPPSFDFSSVFAPGVQVDLFFPFPLTPETDRWGNTLSLVGRLKPGVPPGQAQAEADVLGDRITAENPRRNTLHPQLTMLREHVSGEVRPALFMLSAAVAVVMLIVCANLSSLTLARTAARQKEMAVRAALGAGRGRLIRQLFTESLLLTGTGAVLGVALAFGATGVIARLTAFRLPLLSGVHVDLRALAVALLAAVLTGCVIGVAPAWQISVSRLAASLGLRGGGDSRQNTWLRGALVVLEIAFACVLLVCSGLLVRSLGKVLQVQLGFHPQSAAALRLDVSSRIRSGDTIRAWVDDALARARGIPGVTAAGITDALPLGKNRSWGASAKDVSYPPGPRPSAFVRLISDGYLDAMGMSLVAGRDFSAHDNPGSAPVMIVNQTMANSLWPGENPLGKIVLGDCAAERIVVGVVRDVRHMALEKESGNEMYIPMRQCDDSLGHGDLVVRSPLSATALSAALETALRPIAPDLPKGGLRPLAALVDSAISARRFTVILLTGFAGFALLLASLGIYGLIAYTVNSRTRDIGLRIALGATPWRVRRGIVGGTLGLALLGLFGGVAASLLLVRSLGRLLYGVTPGDPLTFAAAALTLIGIAALAGYLPARRASRVDPMICLRAE